MKSMMQYLIVIAGLAFVGASYAQPSKPAVVKPELKEGNARGVREAVMNDMRVAAEVVNDLKSETKVLTKPERAALLSVSKGYTRNDPVLASNAASRLNQEALKVNGRPDPWYVRMHGTESDLVALIAAEGERNPEVSASAIVFATMRLGLQMESYFPQLLTRGVYGNDRYTRWFVRYVSTIPVSEARALVLSELRGVLARPASTERDLWARDLRAQQLILKEMVE